MTTKTDQELAKLLADTRAAFREVRFAAAGARAKDPNAAKKSRATIARIRSEQHARSVSSSQTAAPAK